jgi:hypothetical protein
MFTHATIVQSPVANWIALLVVFAMYPVPVRSTASSESPVSRPVAPSVNPPV